MGGPARPAPPRVLTSLRPQAYRGYDSKKKLHKYEWLRYFDSKAEKDAYVESKRDLFRR